MEIMNLGRRFLAADHWQLTADRNSRGDAVVLITLVAVLLTCTSYFPRVGVHHADRFSRETSKN